MFVTAFSSDLLEPIVGKSKSGISAGRLIEDFTQAGVKKVGATFKAATPDSKMSIYLLKYSKYTSNGEFGRV
jgi:hypothetical protein